MLNYAANSFYYFRMLPKILIVGFILKCKRGGYEVAFLNFLKKKGANIDENLDIPPVPPPGIGFKGLPEPKFSEEEFPEMNGLPLKKKGFKQGKLDLPPLPDIDDDFSEEFDIPKPNRYEKIPALPSLGEGFPEMPNLDAKPEERSFKQENKITQKEEREEENKRIISKPVFVSVDKFRDVFGDIKYIRADLKELKSFLEEEREEGKGLGKLKNNLDDIQKKLNFY